MAKIALLIGVSEYGQGLNPLPSAVKDVEAMQRVLQNPAIGEFDRTETLTNPDPLVMQGEIETLCANRSKNDLILLFFSGHGVKDDNNRLYFATTMTRKTAHGELVKSTAVPASFMHEMLESSKSKRQIVLLDCCFSGAFAEDMRAKDDGSVDVKTQLGGQGRAVLTSSSSTQYSFEQQGSDLSIYTRFLVEGLESGAADLNGDGAISIYELHNYASQKVQESAPAMKPEFYSAKEGFEIRLAKAPVGDPKLSYRKEVEHFAIRGEISDIGRYTLNIRQKQLGISPVEAQEIEAEVLKPYREYQQKLQQYEDALTKALERENPLTDHTRQDLKRFQEVLGLENQDVEEVGAKLHLPSEEVQSQLVSPPQSSKTELPPVQPPHREESTNLQENAVKQPGSISHSSKPNKIRLLIGLGVATAAVAFFASVFGNMGQLDTTSPSPTPIPDNPPSSPVSPSPPELPPESVEGAPSTSTPFSPSTPDPTFAPTPTPTASSYFKGCTKGTWNVIAASYKGDDRNEALGRIQSLRSEFPNFRFKLWTTVGDRNGNNKMFAAVAGHGLSRTEAQTLAGRLRNAGVPDNPYPEKQDWNSDCQDESGVER